MSGRRPYGEIKMLTDKLKDAGCNRIDVCYEYSYATRPSVERLGVGWGGQGYLAVSVIYFLFLWFCFFFRLLDSTRMAWKASAQISQRLR